MILSIGFATSQRSQFRVTPTLDIVLGGKNCEFFLSPVLLTGISRFDDSNPMLGETFEDQRMRFIAKKVRHSPLEIAYHAEGRKWELYSSARTKFCCKSLEINPLACRI